MNEKRMIQIACMAGGCVSMAILGEVAQNPILKVFSGVMGGLVLYEIVEPRIVKKSDK